MCVFHRVRERDKKERKLFCSTYFHSPSTPRFFTCSDMPVQSFNVIFLAIKMAAYHKAASAECTEL